MREAKPSITALVTAFLRGYHAQHAAEPVFDDRLVMQLLSAEQRRFLADNLASAVDFFAEEGDLRCDHEAALAAVVRSQAPVGLSRARYAEEILESAIKCGASQYVILGAGLDTFAFRRPDLIARLAVIELDLPATQDYKRRRLAEIAWSLPEGLHFVACDLANEGLKAALDRSPYDSGRRTFFSWLGVTYYLPVEASLATLRSIAQLAPPGSAVVFDFLDREALEPGKAGPGVQRMQMAAARSGEPMQGGFDPERLAQELAKVGLRRREQLAPSDIEQRYFAAGDTGCHAREQVHFAWAEVG